MRPANRETTISMPTVSGYLLLLLTLGFESFLTQVAFAQTNIYYGDQNSHLIVETNVATPTASRSILASGSSSVDTPTGMALDRSQGILYWGNQGSTSIRQVNISSAGSVSDFISNQANVFGVVFDPVNDKVYWLSLIHI